jgi:CHAT domain
MADTPGYVDFDLRIWSEGKDYVAQVIGSPAGRSPTVKLRPLFPDVPHAELLLQLENAVLRGQGMHRGPMSREETVLREFGSEMFRAVWETPAIAAQFRSSLNLVPEGVGLRLKLHVEPPELAVLPWEYVYDELAQTYLCLRNRSPLVRFLDLAAPPPALAVKGPLNILGMISNPGGEWEPLDTEKERRRIDEAIEPMKSLVNFRWVQGGTAENLLDIMEQESWHVFHFIGHGGTERVSNAEAKDAKDQLRSFIVLSDGRGGAEKVPAFELGLLLQGKGSLRLAVLNCCESARSAGENAFSSLGASLVQAGVPVVVAMQFPITDRAAIEFARGFYKSLSSGAPVERAITLARVNMRLKSSVEWGIPVLFTRASTGTIFVVERSTVASKVDELVGVQDEYATRRAQAQEQLRKLLA